MRGCSKASTNSSEYLAWLLRAAVDRYGEREVGAFVPLTPKVMKAIWQQKPIRRAHYIRGQLEFMVPEHPHWSPSIKRGGYFHDLLEAIHGESE